MRLEYAYPSWRQADSVQGGGVTLPGGYSQSGSSWAWGLELRVSEPLVSVETENMETIYGLWGQGRCSLTDIGGLPNSSSFMAQEELFPLGC